MKEQKWIAGQMFHGRVDNLSSTGEPRMSISYRPFRLRAARSQPLVGKGEASTTMIVFLVVDANGPAAVKNRAVFGNPVRDAGDQLRQMDGGVCVVADTEEKNLAVEIEYPAHRAFGNVRRKRQTVTGDPRCLRSVRCKREAVIPAPHTRQPPEEVGDHAEIFRGRSGCGIERLVIIPRPGRHNQRAMRPKRAVKGFDEPGRSALNRPHGTE